ncbi:glutaredoxin-like protein NrdH [Salana multivorans]
MTITVFSKPNCVQCSATYRALDKHGLTYTVVDLSEDAEALDTVKALGYQQAPVVFANGDHWAGFRPDKIKSFVAVAEAAALTAEAAVSA